MGNARLLGAAPRCSAKSVLWIGGPALNFQTKSIRLDLDSAACWNLGSPRCWLWTWQEFKFSLRVVVLACIPKNITEAQQHLSG